MRMLSFKRSAAQALLCGPVFSAVFACRGVLGLHEVGCLTSADCRSNLTCSLSHECVESSALQGDGPLERVDGASPGDGDEAGPDGAASLVADAGPSEGNTGSDGADAGVTEADTPDAAPAAATFADACIASNGLCVACTAVTCDKAYAGWTQPPANPGGAPILDNMLDAVAVQITTPSWLMRLGVESMTAGVNAPVNAHLGLYTDLQGAPDRLVAAVDVTVQWDGSTHGSEGSVTGDALCTLLDKGQYWIAAVFDQPVFVVSNNQPTTTRYEWPLPYANALGDLPAPPAGSLKQGAIQRNLYLVVTAP